MSEFEQTPKTPSTYNEDIDQALEIARAAGPAPEPESASLFENEDWFTASDAARRTVDAAPQPAYEQPIEQPVDRSSPSKAIMKGVGVTLAAGAVLGGLYEANKTPEFSEETTTYTLQEGEGLHAAAQHVKGDRDIRDAVEHIKADPANIDVLEDGLQLGEQLVIPVSTADYTPEDDQQ